MEFHHLLYQELLHGDSLLQDNRYIKILNQMFPNCYILNREGRVFFSPDLTPEQNKQNQLKCLENIPGMDEMKKNIAKNTIEQLLSTKISQLDSEKKKHSLDEFHDVAIKNRSESTNEATRETTQGVRTEGELEQEHNNVETK